MMVELFRKMGKTVYRIYKVYNKEGIFRIRRFQESNVWDFISSKRYFEVIVKVS